MSNYKWGGVRLERGGSGMANPAIEAFSGNRINSFVRELIQNSLDARVEGKTPRVVIRRKRIGFDELPELSSTFKTSYLAVKQRWGQEHKAFFENADAVLGRTSIDVLEFSDYNCTGLEGGDDEYHKSFHKCVIMDGSSGKSSGDSLGSFGIGKNAVFALSAFHAVVYSSYNSSGPILQGIAKLGSHSIDGVEYDSRIFFGRNDSRVGSIRERELIPTVFRRDEVESGLSQYVLGVTLQENWFQEVYAAVLDNFYVALHQGLLSVELIDDLVQNRASMCLDAKTLEGIMSGTGVIDVGLDEGHGVLSSLKLRLSCLAERPRIQAIKDENDNVLDEAFVLHLKELGASNEPYNKVNYTRGGMHIKEVRIDGRSVPNVRLLNVCGVFYSRNSKINKALQMMEPPSHDAWETSRLEDRIGKLERRKLNWAKGITSAIHAFVRDEVKGLLDDGDNFSEPKAISEVNEFLNVSSQAGGRGGKRGGRRESDDERANVIGGASSVALSFNPQRSEASLVGVNRPGGSNSPKGNGAPRAKQNPRGGGSKNGQKKLEKNKVSPTFILSDINESGVKTVKLILSGEESLNEKISFSVELSDSNGRSGGISIVEAIDSMAKKPGDFHYLEQNGKAIFHNVNIEGGKGEVRFSIKTIGGAAFTMHMAD